MISYHDDYNYNKIKETKKRNIMLRLMLLKMAILIISGSLIMVIGFTLFMGVTAETFGVLSAVFLLISFFGLSVAAKGLSDFFNFFDKY